MQAVETEYLDYDDVMKRFDAVLTWVARLYINTLNIIHYMHDKYAYERLQMSLHDKDILRTMACGIAGLSVVADSLSAIKYAKVKVIRNEDGLAVDYDIEGDYPKFGNNDDRVDNIAVMLVKNFMEKLENRELIDILFLLFQYLLLHQMLYMVKRQVIHLMEEKQENLLAQVQTQCTEEI